MKQIESLLLNCEGKCHRETNHKYKTTYQIRNTKVKYYSYVCENCGQGTILHSDELWRLK